MSASQPKSVEALAKELAVKGQALRHFLRTRYGKVGKGKRWVLDASQEQALREKFVGRGEGQKIAFIGGGAMGGAMIQGLLTKGRAQASDLVVSDVSPARRSYLSKSYGVTTTADNKEAAGQGDLVVLAIKPQVLPQVMKELQGNLRPGQLVVSIVAGASLATLRRGLKHDQVVRAMPNMPAQIGEGFCLWTATRAVPAPQKKAAQSLLGALGAERYVEEERYLDMATAVSGSGPAYIFLIIESLIEAAVHLGLPRELATTMVLQTVLGSTLAVQKTGRHPAELKNLVTSPGGTTVEGLLQLEEGGLRALLTHAVLAAYEKAKILAVGEPR